MIIPPPPSLVEKWARENPRQAVVFLLFGFGMFGFTIWIIVSDWLHP
jgi:hypothetical protein